MYASLLSYAFYTHAIIKIIPQPVDVIDVELFLE